MPRAPFPLYLREHLGMLATGDLRVRIRDRNTHLAQQGDKRPRVDF